MAISPIMDNYRLKFNCFLLLLAVSVCSGCFRRIEGQAKLSPDVRKWHEQVVNRIGQDVSKSQRRNSICDRLEYLAEQEMLHISQPGFERDLAVLDSLRVAENLSDKQVEYLIIYEYENFLGFTFFTHYFIFYTSQNKRERIGYCKTKIYLGYPAPPENYEIVIEKNRYNQKFFKVIWETKTDCLASNAFIVTSLDNKKKIKKIHTVFVNVWGNLW